MTQPPNPTDQLALRRRLARIARVMDDSIRIPIIGKRIGWDAVLGLVPGVGDVATALISGYIVIAGWRLGVPGPTLARMLANIGIETVVGTVPVLGDIFDMAFKANVRNVALVERHLTERDASAHEPSSDEPRAPAPPGQRGAPIWLIGLGGVVAVGVAASRLLAFAL